MTTSDFDNVEEIDTNCSDWILKPESVLDGCYFYNKEVSIELKSFHFTKSCSGCAVHHLPQSFSLLRSDPFNIFQINQDFHCTAHAKVYHCRPDTMDGKNGKTDPRLVYDQTINYDFKKHGYGYWTGVDGSGEIVVVKDAEEPNNIQEISKKLYEKFDECKTSRTNLYLLTLDTSFHEVISIVKN